MSLLAIAALGVVALVLALEGLAVAWALWAERRARLQRERQLRDRLRREYRSDDYPH